MILQGFAQSVLMKGILLDTVCLNFISKEMKIEIQDQFESYLISMVDTSDCIKSYAYVTKGEKNC